MQYTQAQIDRANAVSLEDFLRTQGETLIKSGREYQNPPDDNITVAYQNRVPRKGDVPTPEEFIRYAAGQIKKETK